MNYIEKYNLKIIICGSNFTNPYNWDKYVTDILKIDKLPENISYNSKK